MPIQCKICNRFFDKQITNSHLKNHSITTTEYKSTYGDDSLSSPEYRQERKMALTGEKNPMFGRTHTDVVKERISGANSGREAHNKGAEMSDEQKQLLREKALERNEKWMEEGSHPLMGRNLSEETRSKIRAKRAEQTFDPETYQKAWETRKKNGWVPPMLGKKHSEENKLKILAGTERHRQERKASTALKRQDAIASINVTLLGDINDHFLHLKCNACGYEFYRTGQVFDPCRIRTDMCDQCYPKEIAFSNQEIEILEFLRSCLPGKEIRHGDRRLIAPLELDIYIPEMNLAVEYCGLYWHSEKQGKGKEYHLYKTQKCAELGVRLITIFEDELIHNKDIVFSRLANLVGKIEHRVGARKCDLVKLSSADANGFLNATHLQGSGRSNSRYGLAYNGDLVSVMTFSRENVSRKITDWELNRFSSKPWINIIGGASKLLKAFIQEHEPLDIISYADRRWSNGNVYGQIGFSFEGNTPPNYWYIAGQKRLHRFALRKSEADDQSISEWENRKRQGWDRIWDCGSIRYKWKAGE